MSYLLNASHVFTGDDDYMTIIGFSNHKDNPEQYVLIQQAHTFDEQDRELGMDKYHIQVDDQSRSLYGGMRSVTYKSNRIVIELDKRAQNALHVDGSININLKNNHKEVDLVLKSLEALLAKAGVPFSSK